MTEKNSISINDYITGIAKATFCQPKPTQKYISLAHFVSLQPRECMFVKDNFKPDGIIIGSIMYLWFPTPDKSDSAQLEYAQAARRRINELITECPNFTEVIVDIRNNIGGILSTFIDAILPLFANNSIFMDSDGVYLYGIDKDGKEEAKFKISGTKHYIILGDGEQLEADLIPIGDIEKAAFTGKKISIICNRYTMSSGEIICIIMRKLGHTVYGEPTRGLTNGCRIIRSGQTKRALIPYYSISDGRTVYKHGIKPDKPESAITKYLK